MNLLEAIKNESSYFRLPDIQASKLPGLKASKPPSLQASRPPSFRSFKLHSFLASKRTMLQILNPLEYPNWDELLLTNGNYSFFHTSGWAKVISESYGYKLLYFTEIENEKLTALMPIMEIKSPLTGQRGVALPFTDHCPVIASDENHFQQLFGKIIEYGKKAQWKTIELRGGEEYLKGNITSETYLTHSLDLTQSEKEVLSTFRSSTKRNIQKAINKDVQVEVLNSLEYVKEFYRLNCQTRKEHGLPSQPFYFFRKLYEHIISTKKGFVILASYHNKVVAGAVYAHFGNKAIFKYGASDKTYHYLRPNNLIMWETIKLYAQNGYKRLSLGRTKPEHEGLLQFKRGWGTRKKTIYYYKYDLTKDTFVKDTSRIKSFHAVFKKLPLPLLKLTGRLFYRHIG